MGQRLNIEIKKGDKILANSYYHWSAYSSSSCLMAVDIMDFMKKNPQNCEDVLYAIRLLEHTGAGLTEFEPTDEEKEQAKNWYNEKYYQKWLQTPSEVKIAKSMFPNETFKECTGRNNGLLAITKEGIEKTRDWEEGRVTIDIGTKTVNFNVCWNYKDYGENYEQVDLNLDLENLTYDGLLKLKEIIEDYCNNDYSRVYKLPNGKIIAFIE